MSESPEVSVVIITRDRVEPLKHCVESILANRRGSLQLVILDNGSEASAKRLRPFLDGVGQRVDLTYRRSAPSGFAEMRREAVGLARGEFIMSIDDDCVADSGAISHIVKRFRCVNLRAPTLSQQLFDKNSHCFARGFGRNLNGLDAHFIRPE